jgi:hypothetical protein
LKGRTFINGSLSWVFLDGCWWHFLVWCILNRALVLVAFVADKYVSIKFCFEFKDMYRALEVQVAPGEDCPLLTAQLSTSISAEKFDSTK